MVKHKKVQRESMIRIVPLGNDVARIPVNEPIHQFFLPIGMMSD